MERTPPLQSGNILTGASQVVITGGTFVASQTNVARGVNESTGRKDLIALIYKKAAPNAILNAGGRADPVKCFPGTREEVLARTEGWMDAAKHLDNRPKGIFWLSGPAGAGKSAIVQTLVERCKARNLPVASFFFFRGDNTRSHAGPFAATILVQLLETFPALMPHIADILAARPMILDLSTHDQFEQLILNPFHANKGALLDRSPIVIFVDGLDECQSESDSGRQVQQALLRTLHALATCKNLPFVVLVASRPESHLTITFNELGSCADSIFLDEDYRPSDDIRLFASAELARIKKTHRLRYTLDEFWPPPSSINAIVAKSSGQFIYAATVLRFIANSSESPAISLEKALGLRPVKTRSPFAELDALYTHVLSQVEDWEFVKHVLASKIFLSLLGVPVSLLRLGDQPPILPSVSSLLNTLHPHRYCAEEFASYMSDLTAIMEVDSQTNRLTFYHASFSDFLCDIDRSAEYYVDMHVFIENVILAHVHAIRNFESWASCCALLSRPFRCVPGNSTLTRPVPTSIIKAFSAPPSLMFEWPGDSEAAHLSVWFLRRLQDFYADEDDKAYKLALGNWLTWFEAGKVDLDSVGLLLRTDVKHAGAIWPAVKAACAQREVALVQHVRHAKPEGFWRRLKLRRR